MLSIFLFELNCETVNIPSSAPPRAIEDRPKNIKVAQLKKEPFTFSFLPHRSSPGTKRNLSSHPDSGCERALIETQREDALARSSAKCRLSKTSHISVGDCLAAWLFDLVVRFVRPGKRAWGGAPCPPSRPDAVLPLAVARRRHPHSIPPPPSPSSPNPHPMPLPHVPHPVPRRNGRDERAPTDTRLEAASPEILSIL